jgi:thiol-disulfide isomerase/thioredoxin
MRRLAPALAGLAMCAGLLGCNSSADTGSVHFMGGGRDAFEAFVAKQHRPVVVNKWASWCGPCRAEFPYLRDQAKKRTGQVTFVGVNSNDNKGDASKFLADNPLKYRQFEDPDLEIAAAFNGVQAFPTTAFYNGKDDKPVFVHQGAYQSEQQLAEDIDRYAR